MKLNSQIHENVNKTKDNKLWKGKFYGRAVTISYIQ